MIKTVDIPIYNSILHILEKPNVAQYKEWIKKLEDDKILDATGIKELNSEIADSSNEGFTKYLGKSHYMFYIKAYHDYDTTAHEIFHAANMILQDHGVELGVNGEAYAYLIGFITKHFYGQK